jgi:putative ABC transport system ATP-binding protein
MSMIEVKNVTKKYVQGKLENFALKGVSFSVNLGEFAVLSGPSGSGKSTALNILGSLDAASSGNVFIDGEDITVKSSFELSEFRLQKLGFIFQSYNLFPVLNAIENVCIPLQLKGYSKKDREEMAMEVLADVGLSGFEKRKPMELSGGQQQRVAVARALVSKPKLILGDEPTANLDTKNAQGLIELMKDMKNKYKTTIVVSSHDEDVIKQAEKSIHLRDGLVVN